MPLLFSVQIEPCDELAGISLPPHLFLTFCLVFGKITILFPDLRGQYLGFERELSENQLTVGTAEVEASAYAAVQRGISAQLPDHEFACRTSCPLSTRPRPASCPVGLGHRPGLPRALAPMPVGGGQPGLSSQVSGRRRDLKSPQGATSA